MVSLVIVVIGPTTILTHRELTFVGDHHTTAVVVIDDVLVPHILNDDGRGSRVRKKH